MASLPTSLNSQDQKQRLEEIDASLRNKYMDIVQSLEIAELRKFTKDRYKKMVVSEIFELLPGADKQAVESTAHYISNMLNNEAQRQLSQKITENRKTNRRST